MPSLNTTRNKDLDKFRKSRYKWKAKYYKRTAGIYKQRKWTSEEDERVLKHEIPDSKLSKQIERSVGSIHIRRSRLLKKVSENDRED